MPDADLLTSQLHALGDEGLDDLSMPVVRDRVEHALARVAAGRPARSWRPACGIRGATLATAIPVLVALVVVAGALVLASGHRPVRTTSQPGAQGLIAKLAVLRHPQTAADRIPADVHLSGTWRGTLLPGLTRRVSVRGDQSTYLVVTTPDKNSDDTHWPASLGDQVSLLSVRGSSAQQSVVVPAADLTNANRLASVSNRPGSGLAQIVPDGVARVSWSYGPDSSPIVTPVSDNVAFAPGRRPGPRRATWLHADGSRVPSSDALASRVQAATDASFKRAALRTLRTSHSRAPAALLGAYAVFDRHPAATRGITITHPSLDALPLPVLQVLQYQAFAKYDLAAIRQVTATSGERVWVLPGAKVICLLGPPEDRGPLWQPSSLGAPAVAQMACSQALSDRATGGVRLRVGSAEHPAEFGILARSRQTTTVPGPDGGRRTIDVAHGVYFARIGQR